MEKPKSTRLTQLSPELEAQLPEEIRCIRAFYFQLSEKEKQELDEESSTETKAIVQKDTKYCFECGQKINRTAKFCEYCGTPQTNSIQTQTPVIPNKNIQPQQKNTRLILEKDIAESDSYQYFMSQKERMLKEYNCKTVDELIQKLKNMLEEDKKNA
ncbi:MAG: zinc-ribbon domain-containing protein [Candidatus Nanoarchaeia archaeon]